MHLIKQSDSRLYGLALAIVRTYMDLAHQLEVSGSEYIPVSGPFILATNHSSFLDPPAFAASQFRELSFFARKTLFRGLMGKLITDLNAIPVDRDGSSDVAAFKRVFKVLRDGRPLLFFPEGTRSQDGSLGPARQGVALIACKAGVPVLPGRIFGGFEAFGRHRKWPRLNSPIHIAYGPVMTPAEYDPGKEHGQRYQVAAERIMDAIRKLRNPTTSAV